MNINALIPLIATIAYIPLLITTINARPLDKQRRLFLLFLVAAMLWSLSDFVFRGHFFPQHSTFLIHLVLLMSFAMVIQFHCFISYYFPEKKGRWLPFAYGSLLINTVLIFMGFIPKGISTIGNSVYADYGLEILFLAVPMLVLLARNIFIFVPRLKNQENPVTYNQTATILLCLAVLFIFLVSSLTPLKKEFPISHLGNIIIAVILSIAVVSSNLLDIRFILRRGFIWAIISIIGLSSFLGLLLAFHALLGIEFTMISMFSVTISGVVSIILMYKLRRLVFRLMDKAFQGESYQYREKLLDFPNKIHNVFSLNDQGSELLLLITKAIGCSRAGLLFADASGDFETQLVESNRKDDPLTGLKLRKDNPIVEYLKGEHRSLTYESLSITPEFLGLWKQEKEAIEACSIDLFLPLISRDKLIGILVLDSKRNGHFNLEDYSLLENVISRVAASMEKEYLREQLKAREEELSVINSSNAIITSSLDIQRIYDNFIKELKRAVNVDWAAISVIEDNESYFMAISTDIGSPWKVGERLPLKGSGTEWVATHGKPTIDRDLNTEIRFSSGKYHVQHGIRTVAYLPLIISNQVIGSLIVSSRKPDAYNSRHLRLLEQLAMQIAMPIENARLYANTERLARIDGLTGLLNRRSLDETLSAEVGRHSRYGGVFSLVIMDVDLLKTVNDNYGHLAGDELLKQIGITIKNTIREADQAFRYGGDEFAILLPQTSIEAAFKVAERIRQQIFARIEIGSIPVSLSVGLASWPADGVNSNEVMAAADTALYTAKRTGRNRSVCSTLTLESFTPSNKTVNASENQDSGALSTIFALAATVDVRDRGAHNHSKQVHDYAIALGEEIGLNPLELNRLGTCALLHDIGKIGINDSILNKKESLTDEEWEIIKAHSKLGATIISHYTQLSQCVQGILHHHERYNGSGYPDGLKGEEIPLESRILAIADSFASMTSARVYSRKLTYEAAIKELKNGAHEQFDPKLVEAFLRIAPKLTMLPEQTVIGS